jgi:hypothetical protein
MLIKPSFQLFNDKVRSLNQTGSKQVILSAQEARNLHHDIFELLNNLTVKKSTPSNDVTQVEMDGGGF